MTAVEEFISKLPPHKSALVSYLRDCVHAASPNITERIAYGLPFFYCRKPLCYLNIKKEGIDVCFMDGNLIRQHPKFISAERKRVRSLFFTWDEDVDVELLQQILAECLSLPKYAAKNR